MNIFDFKNHSYTNSIRSYFGINGVSGFGSSSTAEQICQRYASVASGKLALVTGCTVGGLGFETAACLAQVGAHVVLTVRSEEKGNQAIETLKQRCPHARVSLLLFDLSDLQSVRGVAEKFQNLFNEQPLHILINNAGIMAHPFQVTKNGIESQFGVNHIGHFALFQTLLPWLQRGAQDGYCRVINVSSLGHRLLGHFTKDTLFDPVHINQDTYSPLDNYGRAKLANVLFAQEIEKRYGAQGIHAMSLHPGGIRTNLGNHLIPPWMISQTAYDYVLRYLFGLKSIPQGAATSVYCALAPDLKYGHYFDDCNLGWVHPWGTDQDLASALWDTSLRLSHQI